LSDKPEEVVAAQPAPVLETTPTIERANRLQALVVHPGWPDVMHICEDLIKDAANTVARYPGWDAQQIVVLKARLQAAVEHQDALTNRIRDAIAAGVVEAQNLIEEKKIPAPTAQQAIESADYVRQEVLKKFEESDLRIPGSY